MLRDARDARKPGRLDLEARRARADRFGDATVPPTGVEYEAVDLDEVPAEWVIPVTAENDRVLLYFHGGGYCHCSVRSHGRLVGHLAKAAGCRALNVDYRLAPESPYPAAVVDALIAYRWLLRHGTEPSHIAVAGDSAGGGLALALILKTREERLPSPRACVLISPWVDLAMTGESLTTRSNVDLLQDPFLMQECAELYLAGIDPHDPSASPLYGDLSGLPPLYIQAGDADLLIDDARRLADKARLAHVDVRLDVFPDMQHIHQIWAGTVPEADEAVYRIGTFLRKRLDIPERHV
jgi:acetyl esterase/lipase